MSRRACRGAGGGDDLKSYAEKRGLSYNTMRYHLKTAFARPAAHQSRLVQHVTSALTEFGLREYACCQPRR